MAIQERAKRGAADFKCGLEELAIIVTAELSHKINQRRKLAEWIKTQYTEKTNADSFKANGFSESLETKASKVCLRMSKTL